MKNTLLVSLLGALALGQVGCGSATGVLPAAHANGSGAANIARALPAAAPAGREPQTARALPGLLPSPDPGTGDMSSLHNALTPSSARALPGLLPSPDPGTGDMSSLHNALTPSSSRALPGINPPDGTPTPPPVDDGSLFAFPTTNTLRAIPI